MGENCRAINTPVFFFKTAQKSPFLGLLVFPFLSLYNYITERAGNSRAESLEGHVSPTLFIDTEI